jgi:starch synthase
MTGKPDSGARHRWSTLVSTDRLDMSRSAMARSFSWDLLVACYSALYRKMVST